MYLRTTILAAAAAFAFVGTAQAADVLTYNSAPTDTWFYGTGNDYALANTAVLDTAAGDELDLRFHQTFQTAPASTGNVYSFALNTTPISFDWGYDVHSGFTGPVTAFLTLAKLGGSSFTYDVNFSGNDNESQTGSTQNSGRLVWFPIGFDASTASTYKATLVVNGLDGGSKSLSAYAKIGDGYSGAVPEPATWALMIMGFGSVGATLRRRRTTAALA